MRYRFSLAIIPLLFVPFLLGSFFCPPALATFGAWATIHEDPTARPLTKPLTIKVLTVTTFELGAITGDAAGEAQLWVEKEHLDKRYSIPGAFSPLYCNDRGHCLMVTGMGTANAASSILALGLHPKVNLKRAYVMLAGIAGGAPDAVTLGGAVWANWIVGTENRHHIDPRELPKGWEFSDFHLGCVQPWCQDGWSSGTEVYQLNSALTEKAYLLSKDVPLADDNGNREQRARFDKQLAASRAPFVTRCDVASGGTFFQGKIMTRWAQWWVKQWTHDQGHFCASAMEEEGLLTALARLGSAGRVNVKRVLVLRTISDFVEPAPGETPLASLKNTMAGVPVAIENAYRVGSAVTADIMRHWPLWEGAVATPSGPPSKKNK